MTAATTSASSSQAEHLRALAGEQLARDRWSRDQLQAWQDERLRALLRHAATASPYYREVLGPHAAAADVPLRELPTLPKATLMDNFDRIVTDPRLRRTEVEAHLASTDPGRPVLGRYRVFATAGTTGLRGLFLYSDEEFATWIATCLRGMACWGLTPATRLAGIGSPSPLHISNQLYAVLLAGRPSGMPRLTVTTPLPDLVAALNAYQPEALTAYPSIAAQLAEEQLHGQLRIAPSWWPPPRRSSPPTCAAASTPPGPWTRSTSTAPPRPPWSPPVANNRPSWTSWRTWSSSRWSTKHNHPVPPGTPGQKLLLTNLVNHTQPLIRYELTDSVTLADGPNPLGLPYARITAVDGRSDDIITLPAPDGGQVPVHPFRLRAPFTHLPEVTQYQIHHDPTGLHVRIVLRPNSPHDTLERIQAALTQELQAAGAVAPPIEVTPVPELHRDQGHGAKFKLIRSTAR